MRLFKLWIGLVMLVMLSACAPREVTTPTTGATIAPTDPAAQPTSTAPEATLPPATEAPTIPAPENEEFMTVDFTQEPWLGVQEQISAAFANGEAWPTDADEVALRFSLSGSGAFTETLEKTDTLARLLVTEFIDGDDSVAQQQLLLELSRPTANDAWVVQYMGMRWICREGRGQQDWAPELCV